MEEQSRHLRSRPPAPTGRGLMWLFRDILMSDLADLLEPVTLHDIHEDHGRRIVALGVPLDGPTVGDPLVAEPAQRADDFRTRRRAPLSARRVLDRPQHEAGGIVRARGVVRDRPEPLRVAFAKL